MATALQDGIYWDKGQRPGRCFAILFLRAERGASAADVGSLFGGLWSVYQGLKQGVVPALGREFPVPTGDLTVVVGYGPKAFELPGIKRSAPMALGPQSQFRSPDPTGGGLLLRGGGLLYGKDVRDNVATEEICLQFIADTQLAVFRCIVETWKVLQSAEKLATGAAALAISGFFLGFQRDDGRSWIDFHDGVSNLQSGDERRRVITVKPETAGADDWTVGGSYLAFLRLGVNLSDWHGLSLAQQQAIVGREKLSGCPLVSLEGAGSAIANCPMSGTRQVTDEANQTFREPPAAVAQDVLLSHVQRANHHRGPVERVDSRRIYRQGFEFLEPSDSAPGFRAGLNFVSFQDDPVRLTFLLTQPGWLGGVNFGGTEGTLSLLEVRAGGIYFAPALVDSGPYPGSDLFPF